MNKSFLIVMLAFAPFVSNAADIVCGSVIRISAAGVPYAVVDQSGEEYVQTRNIEVSVSLDIPKKFNLANTAFISNERMCFELGSPVTGNIYSGVNFTVAKKSK